MDAAGIIRVVRPALVEGSGAGLHVGADVEIAPARRLGAGEQGAHRTAADREVFDLEVEFGPMVEEPLVHAMRPGFVPAHLTTVVVFEPVGEAVAFKEDAVVGLEEGLGQGVHDKKKGGKEENAEGHLNEELR